MLFFDLNLTRLHPTFKRCYWRGTGTQNFFGKLKGTPQEKSLTTTAVYRLQTFTTITTKTTEATETTVSTTKIT